MFAIERSNDIEILRMQSGAANVMDVDFCLELTKTLRELEKSSSRGIVLTGQGKIFSAGVDLPQMLEGGRDYISRFLPVLSELITSFAFCPKPLVAAVNGHAIAGGCLLACTADRSLMAAGKGQIGVPEVRVGVPFPVVLFELMRAKTNPVFFPEIVQGGATYAPHDALQRGLVDEVVEPDQLLCEAISVAESYAAIRPEVFAFTKRQVRQPMREAIEARSGIQDAECFAFWDTEETLAAIRAFVDKTLKK